MSVSPQERISHVVRRLGLGAHGQLVAGITSVDEAIATALDLTAEPAPPPQIPAPRDVDDARRAEQRRLPAEFWFTQMIQSGRLVEERLVWFWHDHFATSIRKVRFPYLMWRQHLTIRRFATGSFADLLHAMATDPALLLYLDGADNQAGAVNENFGREVMELFTMGRGTYAEADVVACAQSCTGWVVFIPRPGRERSRIPPDVEAWTSLFVPRRHQAGSKTFLGVTGPLDLEGAMDVILERPETKAFVASKLYGEIVGGEPDTATLQNLVAAFADYEIMRLVEAITATPQFLADETISSKVRTPLERVVGGLQAFGGHQQTLRAIGAYLETVDYMPWVPPNVAGFPRGTRLIGPHTLVHGFDAALAVGPDVPDLDGAQILHRLGIYDMSSTTRRVLDATVDPRARIALALNCPEYALT